MKPNLYTLLGWIARVLTPASMVIFLTMEIVNSQSGVSGVWVFLIPVAAFFTSIGIEFWGMLSGSNIEKAWQMQRSKTATAVQLVLYVALAMWMLRNNSTLFVLPIMASLVYVSAAMSESLNKHEARVAVEARQSLAIQVRKQEAQAQRDHEARMKQMEFDAQAKIALDAKHEDNETAVKLARIEAKKRAEVRTDSQTLTDSYKTDWRTLSDIQRSQIARLTPEQIINQYSVSSKTAGRWLQKAGQFHPEMSTNGHAK